MTPATRWVPVGPGGSRTHPSPGGSRPSSPEGEGPTQGPTRESASQPRWVPTSGTHPERWETTLSNRQPEADDIVEIADRVCTRAQAEAVELYESGFGYRLIAQRLGLSPTTVRDRLDRAWIRIDQQLARDRAEQAEEA